VTDGRLAGDELAPQLAEQAGALGQDIVLVDRLEVLLARRAARRSRRRVARAGSWAWPWPLPRPEVDEAVEPGVVELPADPDDLLDVRTPARDSETRTAGSDA
jgi:hypothetical protein